MAPCAAANQSRLEHVLTVGAQRRVQLSEPSEPVGAAAFGLAGIDMARGAAWVRKVDISSNIIGIEVISRIPKGESGEVRTRHDLMVGDDNKYVRMVLALVEKARALQGKAVKDTDGTLQFFAVSEDSNKVKVTATMPSRRPRAGEAPWDVVPIVRGSW